MGMQTALRGSKDDLIEHLAALAAAARAAAPLMKQPADKAKQLGIAEGYEAALEAVRQWEDTSVPAAGNGQHAAGYPGHQPHILSEPVTA
jgi:hypothetical protein